MKKIWTWNNYLAIILLVILVLLSVFIIMPHLYTWNIENNNLQQPRAFHIVFSHNFDKIPFNIDNETSDVTIDVTLTYPHGTLIVDDPVDISGIAILNPSISRHVKSVTIYFQMAQAYPIFQDENGITKGQDLLINQSQNGNKLTGNTTVVWTLEGTYYAEGGLVFTNETGTYALHLGFSSDVAITVYPKEKLAQIVTNNVSMILAFIHQHP